jgi:hypothetical protein
MHPDTYAAGVRRRYEDLPPPVHHWVEALLGGPVVRVENKVGGFSPGTAAVVSDRQGRQLFVKGVGSEVNPDSIGLYAREAGNGPRLPAVEGLVAPVAAALLDVGAATFQVIAYPALPGSTPRHPWQEPELTPVLDALDRLSRRLTPSPWPASSADRLLLDFFHGWESIAGGGDHPWRDDPWVRPLLSRFVAVEQEVLAALPGETLTHIDLRADNIITACGEVWFVDWASAQNCASWVAAAILLGDVIASRADRADGGSIDVAEVIRRHPSLRAGSFETVWGLELCLAGALHALSRRPDPPGLPTIRGWQGRTAQTLLGWCRRESLLD